MDKEYVLVTGATGTVGKVLSKFLIDRKYNVIGVARSKPDWWGRNGLFFESDLSTNQLYQSLDNIKHIRSVIHLYDCGRKDPLVNLQTAKKIFQYAIDNGVDKFFYASSIRVYSKHYGTVTEKDRYNAFRNDQYAQNKINIETALVAMANCNIKLCVARLGSVFSAETPQKLPHKNRNCIDKLFPVRNPHLISANNVAASIEFLISNNQLNDIEYVNLTQESDECTMDFLRFRLYGEKKINYFDWLGYLFYWVAFPLGLGRAGYFNRIIEDRLLELGFKYKSNLISDIKRTNY